MMKLNKKLIPNNQFYLWQAMQMDSHIANSLVRVYPNTPLIFQNYYATMQLKKIKMLNGTLIPKSIFYFVFPLLSLCSQHNLYFKKSCIVHSEKISFWHEVPL